MYILHASSPPAGSQNWTVYAGERYFGTLFGLPAGPTPKARMALAIALEFDERVLKVVGNQNIGYDIWTAA